MRTKRLLTLLLPLFLGSALLFDFQAPRKPTEAAAEAIGPVRDRVSIFVTSWCPYCRSLEEFLRANNVPHTRYDIEKNAKGAMLYRNLGGGGIPVIQIGSTVLRGFDEAELSGILMERRAK